MRRLIFKMERPDLVKEGDIVRGREIATNNKIMEAMDAMEEQMQSGGMPPMGGGSMPTGGMR